MKIISLVACVALATVAVAQTPIGPFTGEEYEDFSGPQQATLAPCLQYRVFDGTADLCTPTGSGCYTTASDFFSCLMSAHSSPYFFFSVDGAVEISFDYEVQRFGGWFGTNQFFADADIEFLDGSGALVASTTATFPADCSWSWHGWDLGASSTVRTIRILGTPLFSEGFVDLDDLQVEYVGIQPPVVYCTAGTTTNGCVPSISASGSPNLAHTAPCQITISGVEGQKAGIVFYGVSGRASSPWCSGGSSVLCVKSPTQRTAAQFSGGTLNACNGTLALDWNAFHSANPSALGSPWMLGVEVDVQGWFRDPPSCKTTNLSNAVELTYQ